MTQFFRDHQNRSFIRVWLAQLISQFGDRLHQMALIGLIAERSPGSVLGLAKILAFTIIPVFVVGPIAGVFVDRWDKRRTLVVCDIIRGSLVLMIPMIFM
ncbi:MAG: MFS transporter, partial [Candidatus Omnitrophica bacterium]|nr:MFS transporter [Candidatus Omnitrophota bacterium]